MSSEEAEVRVGGSRWAVEERRFINEKDHLERVGASKIHGSPVWEAVTKDGALELGKKPAHKRKFRWIVTRTYWLSTIFFNIATNLKTE